MALSPWQLCFHTDLKCRVRSCNNKRIINNAVFSPYCRYHVCTVCLKQKSGFKRGHGEDRICRHHSCAHPTCHSPHSKKHINTTYCLKHACNIRTCDQPRHAPGLCCIIHTCRGRGCVNCVHPPSSPDPFLEPAPTEAHYCPGHRPCQAPGCPNLAFQDPSHRAGAFCFRHYCAAAAGCEGQRVDPEVEGGRAGVSGYASACREHTCALYPACAKPRVDAERGLFCKSHECAETGCRKQRYDSGSTGYSSATIGVGLGSGVRRGPGGGAEGKPGKGIWCADHMCMAALTRQEDCPNRREGTPTNPLYCPDHELCEEVGCAAFCAIRGRGMRLARCEEHLKSKCAFPSCPLDTEGNAAACRYHVCRADGCLTMLPPTITSASPRTSLFCDVHRCVESECVNPRLTTTSALPPPPPLAAAAMTTPPGDGGNMYCAEHVHQRRMGLGLGAGLCSRHGIGCRHTFEAGYGGGICCRFHGGGDDDDDSGDDDTITDRGRSSSVGVGLDISQCFFCSGTGDCKKCHKCMKC